MSNFTVALPEISKDAHLSFDVAAMEALHQKYGDHYVNDTISGLDRNDVTVFTAALKVMLKNTDIEPAAAIEKFTLSDLAGRIADAIAIRIHGKTFRESAAATDAEIAAPDADKA